VSIDGSENGSVLNPRGADPVFQRPDGAVNGPAERDADPPAYAVLVGLRPPDGQNDPLPDPLDVNEVNCSELGSPEAACKSDQQQSPVPDVFDPIAHRPEDDEEVLTEKRLRLMLGRPVSPSDAPQRRPDHTGRRVIRLGGDLRRGFSRPLVRPPEGDGLANVLAGTECIQDEAGDVGSRNRRRDGARADPCGVAAGACSRRQAGRTDDGVV